MDRTITYTQAIPRSQDFLQGQKNSLDAIGYLAQSILGQPGQIFNNVIAWLDGLTCSPINPPGMSVSVDVGSIYMMEEMDANPYGVLGVDTHNLLKQGILLDPVTLPITAPLTSGFSQYYVVQAAYNDIDGGATVLPYFNAAAPLIPLGGPANSGQQQFTIRQGACVISLKAGVAAPTGTQLIPSADPGFTPMWTVLVNNGQTAITSVAIAQVANAPFISPKLTQVPPAIQAQKDNFAVDVSGAGTPNAMSIVLPSFTPSPPVQGLTLRIQKSAFKNTASPTLTIFNATTNVFSTPQNIAWADGSALQPGDWPGGAIGQITYNGSSWELYTIAGPTIFARVAPGSTPTVTDASLLHYGVDTGTANAAVCAAVTPAITSSVTVGTAIEIQKINQANSGSMTVAITATGGTVTAPLFWADGSQLQPGDWPLGAVAYVMFDGTVYRLLSVTQRPVKFPEGAYVHYGVAAGINTLVTTTTPLFTAMADGLFLELTPTAPNTGPVTLTANGLSPTAIQTITGANLAAGQLQPNQPVLLMALGGVWKMFFGGSSGGGITNVQVFLNSGTYTPTTGAQKALVFATAGGAAGGVGPQGGCGGGAGGTALALVNLTGVTTIPVTIGAGGGAVTAGFNQSISGGNGGATSFGTFAAASGGQGGTDDADAGHGGLGTAGIMQITGGDGFQEGASPLSGGGGDSFWGGGGAGNFDGGPGNGYPGRCYGSGGGGGDSALALRVSGGGMSGVVLVLEF